MIDEQLMIKTDDDKKPSFSKYPEQFQINLAKLIIQDRAFSSQMQEVLELSYFEKDYLKSLIDSIFKYKDKYGVHPAEDTVDMIISTQFKNTDQIKKNQIENFWNSYKKNRKIEDPDFYMKTALDFCRSQKMLEALSNSFDLLKEGSIDQFMENISKAGSLGSSQNFGHDYKEDFEKRYEKDHREPITTGWDELDNVTKGGIGLGEVFVYISPPSGGKTARMIYTACKNLQKGLNVAYFTLEMSEVEIGQRFDACLSEIHLEELVNNKEAIRSKLEELPGKLRIIEEEYCSTTPRRIFNKVKKLEETGFPVDLVVIDYADITAPTKSMKDDDGMVGGVQVYSEIKTLTQRFWKRTLTAAQTNREGAEAEVITPKHFEGMFKRFNPCHFVVGFSKYGKVKELKTRVGPAFILNEQRDLGRVRTFITKIDDDGDLLDHAAAEMKKAKSNKNVQSILQSFLSKEKDKFK